MSDVGKVLGTMATVAEAIGVALAPATGGLSVAIGKIAAAAFGAGAAFAADGKDPVVEIERILSAREPVDKVHQGWDAAIDRKFGAPDTVPSPPVNPFEPPDVYDEEE